MQLTDGDGGTSLSDQRIVYFTTVNDEEVLATNTVSTVSEASTGNVLTTAMLETTDVDNTPAQLTYTITSGASNGTLRLSGTVLGVSDTFSQADIDAGLVTYDHDGSETVGDSFGFTVDDGAGTNSSGTFSITVTPVNDEEVLATNTGATVSEGSNSNLLTAAMLQTTDADHAAAQLVYTVDAVPSNGTLYRNGVVLNVSDSFTQADIDANLITYDHDGSQTSSDSFDFTVDDGSGSTTSASFNWMVTNVNDAPVVTVPSTQNVNEDVAIAIGGLSVADDDGNLATVQLTANNGVLNVSLQGGASISAGANGSSLLTVSGLQADINSTLATLGYQGNTNWNGTDTISVLATDGNGLTHVDSFDVTVAPVNDSPVLQNGSTMTIVEGPSGVAPLGGKVMTDVDGVDFDGGVLTAQVTTGADGSERLWFASGVHLSNVGSTLYYDATIIGTVSGLWSSGPIVVTFNANATQTEVQEVYSNIAIGIPGDNAAPGDRTLEVTLTDGDGGTSNTSLSTLHVTLVNDNPFNSGSLPTDVAVTEDVSTAIDLSSIDLADPDANSGGLTLKLTAGAGNLTAVAAAGITISGDGTNSLSLTGTLGDLNAYLDGPSNLAYLHPTAHLNGNDADTITIAINDNGNSGSGGGADQSLGVINVDITPVNDEQVLATNTGATVSEGSNNNILTAAMLQTTDVDHAAAQLMYTVNAVPSNGTLYRNGVALNASDSFTQADIDANLITYDHDGSETSSDSFGFTVDDGIGSTTSAAFNWTVTNVNDAPVLDTTGDMSLTPITEDDVNNNGNSVAEIIASAGGDRITDEDLGSVEGIALRTATTNFGSWQYSLDGGLNWANVGTVADSSALLLRDTDRIRFVPVTDVGGTDAFTFRAWDQTSGSAGTKVSTANAGADFAFSVNIETDTKSMTDVNDGPQVTAPISAFVVNEQTNLAIHGTGFSVTDVDAQSGTMTASIAVGEGALVVFEGDSGVTVTSGNGTNQVNFVGSLAQINHLLTGAGTGTITYGNGSDTPANFTTITVTVNDGGNTGSDPGLTGDGTSEESSASQTINLTAINDDPVNSGGLPSSVTVVEDVDSNVDLSALNLADVDAGGGLLTVALQTSSGGQLTVAPGVGVTIGGTSTARTITGTLIDLNNYFDDVTKIQYLHGTPQTNGNNADSIIVSVNDNGNTGVGGGTDVVLGATPVHISAVNDEEVLTTNTGASFLEGSHSNLLTTAMLETLDVDHSANQIVYSLVAGPAHGQLFLNGSPLSSTDTYTQADIDAGRVHYNHDGSETTLDSFAFQVDDGVGTSTSASFAISIVPVNDEQVISVNSVASVVEGSTNNVLSKSLLQTTDVDHSAANLTYTITANPAQGTLMRSGVVLAVSDSFTQADIDAGLITYDHSGSEATVDSFGFVVDDGVGLISSGTFVWSIVPVNDVPVITAIEAGSLLYTENDGAVAVTSILSLADADDILLAGARIQIVSNYSGSQDSLLFVNQSGIAGAWNATSGELTLSGSASLAEYADAIQSVRYVNDSETPSTAVRTIRITVNDGQADASSVTRDILITSVNDLPQATVDHYLLAASLSTISVDAADGLLANDTDLDGETLRAILVTPPLIGNLTLQPDGSFRYDALPGFTGSISFEYAVSDASTQSSPTVVTLEIQGAQTPGVSQPPEPNSSPDEIDLDEQDADDSTDEVGDGQPGVIVFETTTSTGSTPTGPGAAKENLDGQFAIVVITENESLEYKQSSDRLDEFAIALESNSLAHQRNVFMTGFDSAQETALDLDDWDKLLHQFRGTVDEQQDSVHWVTGSASAIFIGVTVGVATWSLSGTYIASLAASSLPAWTQFDPVFVLRHAATVRDEKSLAQIIQERKKRHENG
ncbi:MAG: tandem-95 repeat protein [Planctomycetales bacterium]|nr:tandem-95 repeat protein [Planctomycetales bacterium]